MVLFEASALDRKDLSGRACPVHHGTDQDRAMCRAQKANQIIECVGDIHFALLVDRDTPRIVQLGACGWASIADSILCELPANLPGRMFSQPLRLSTRFDYGDALV